MRLDAVQSLIDLIFALVALIAAAAMSQFGVRLDHGQAERKSEVRRMAPPATDHPCPDGNRARTPSRAC